jgi:tetratricopeptide (TPR) repeat protein
MNKQKLAQLHNRPAAIVVILFGLLLGAPHMPAQTPDGYNAERERAIKLINDSKFAEALPLFEKLAAANQTDSQVMYGLGIAVLMNSRNISEPNARRTARLRARTTLLRAKELGVSDPNLDLMIKSVAPDGGEPGRSESSEANAAMDEAFKFFAKKDYEKAAAEYERAAKLDPKLYEAALYTGNSHYALKNWDKAGEWFTRAIALDPDREIAHRYWGDALMLSGRQEAAREKFLDAIIGEPYSQLAWKGLINWAQRNEVTLAHPKIDIPANAAASEKGGVTVTLDPRSLTGKNDGSAAWMMYGLIRAAWLLDSQGKLSEKFVRAHPSEKTYRHSLAEEADALRMVVTSLREQMKGKDVKVTDPSLATLVKLHDAGLLESYILMARSDPGISKDYANYRAANRDKLRRYLAEFVINAK